jgi:phage terminase large subunit-like protein
MAAISGHYMAWADGEPGAEVYSGASTEKQAWEVFGPARLMVKNNSLFRTHFGIYVGAKNLACLEDASKFEPIIGNPGDGAKASCSIVDEYHEHKTSALYDTMKTGMGNRRQPMRIIITTAGIDTSGPCYAKRDEAIKILSGVMENDELFAIIYTIDDGDDWTQQATWKKANPNYGISVKEDFLEAARKEAIAIASQQNILKCKHLNIWAAAGSAWINMVTWKKNKRDIRMSDFAGEPCWIGVDLASKIDLTAMMFLFRREDAFYIFGKYYLPEETIQLPQNDHYRRWLAEGHLISTPGARTDYRYLMDDLMEWDRDAARKCPECGQLAVFAPMHDLGWLCEKEKGGCESTFDPEYPEIAEQEVRKALRIQELAYDPREAEMLMQQIREIVGFPCVEINQAPAHISEPMKEFEALYTSGNLLHDGDPALAWQAANVILKSSKTKFFYPSKERDENKIDGIVAAIMALARAMAEQEGPSIYESQGLTVLG